MELSLGIESALENRNAVLFVGSGVGHHAKDSLDRRGPVGNELAQELAAEFNVTFGEGEQVPPLAALAQLLEHRVGREKVVAFIDRRLRGLEPDATLTWLASRPWKAIYTTNYDNLISRAYDLVDSPSQSPVVIGANSEYRYWNPVHDVPIVHLHGALYSTESKSSILLTEDDYSSYAEKRRMLFEMLRLDMASSPIIYVGYSHNDPNWKDIDLALRQEFQPSKPPRAYRIAPGTSEFDRELLFARGIECLDGTLTDFRDAVVRRFGEETILPPRPDGRSLGLPASLVELHREEPASVARLHDSWELVHDLDMSGDPNTDAFLLGEPANWALVGAGINFQRDVEEPLYEELLAFATEPEPKVESVIVLGPAGYGTSTILKAVTAWYSKNRVGSCLFLREGAEFRANDVFYAACHLPGPVVFVVDDAATHHAQITEAVRRLRDHSVAALILAGERINQWRQIHAMWSPREYILEPLSDGEAERLIRMLEVAGKMGHLGDLSDELRRAAVYERNRKELLVTLREVTEGKAFDAIIEDEFSRINDDEARDVYEFVCAFSRVKASPRDRQVAESLGIPLERLHHHISSSLAGVVRVSPAGERRSVDIVAARHPVIADIVWNNSMTEADRERHALIALKSLNLAYGPDARSFSIFTRATGDEWNIQSRETLTRFFEMAVRKDPGDAYVRQHFARMLRASGEAAAALVQIDHALSMSPNNRLFRHTRGLILRDQALETESVGIAQRRIGLAESEFEQCIRQDPRDDYAYVSLAEMLLDWASTLHDVNQQVKFQTRAQEVVNRGLAQCRVRDSLYVTSSRVEEALGNGPESLAALNAALEETPSSALVRSVLGRALLKSGNAASARQVLEEGLTSNPDDHYLALGLARALMALGERYEKCLAVLELARRTGESDPVFCAAYGGLLAFVGKVDEGQKVFDRAVARFDRKDLLHIGLVMKQGTSDLVIAGKVVSTRLGYAFIEAEGLPAFFCPGSKYSGRSISVGDQVSFVPGFTARGPRVVTLC